MSPSRLSLAGGVLAALALAPAALAGQEQPAAPTAPPTPPTVFSNSRVIVEWTAGADHAEKVDARSDAEVEFQGDLGNRSFQLVEVESGQTATGAIEELRASPGVLLAERDAAIATNSIPNDPEFDQLWGLQNGGLGIDGFPGAVPGADVNAPAAWSRTVGDPAIVVADIDSGYRFEHPDLANVAWTNTAEAGGTAGVDDDGNGIVDDIHGADFIGNNGEAPATDGNPTDEDLITGGHGVHTAGTIGAEGNNNIGITGVAQDVSIMPLRVCSRFPIQEKSSCLISSVVAAINYAKAKGARVANMSLGGNNGFQSEVNAIAEAKETLFVISAGNDGSDNDGGGAAPQGHHFPCDYTPQTQASPPVSGAIDNIICVAATNQADGLAGFSDWGATSVDLGAPGTETLSAYPYTTPFEDTFTVDDFNTRWPATGANGGFERTNESPLTSFGMTDVTDAPAANSVRETTSTAVSLPANGGCRLNQTRRVVLGGGSHYRYSVLLNGVEQGEAVSEPASTSVPGLDRRFLLLPAAFKAGGNVQVRFRFTTGPSPTAGDGVWLDDLSIVCAQAVGQASSYGFLQGTSMAAPHVTGAAGLLFSLEPLATVTEVKNALLAGVDAVPSLTGKTTSGGRLDVSKAMDSLEGLAIDNIAPSKPILPDPVPGSGSNDNHPRIKGSAEAGSTVTIFKGGPGCPGSPVATGTAAQLAGAGIELTVPDNSITFFTATATDAARNKSTCSAMTSYLEDSPEFEVINEKYVPGVEIPVAPNQQIPSGAGVQPIPATSCTVPKVAGMTLGKATSALSATHCALGTVTKPKAKKGHRLGALVVKSSSPPAGVKTSGKVSLTLGAKPKPKKHHH